jgi:[ribosomal protein S5]-alanine N-acetyltransferase
MATVNRVELRPLQAEDITDRYIAWFRDPDVIRYLDSSHFEKEDTLRYLQHGLETRSYFMHAIIDRATDTHIGNLKIGPISWKHGVSDLITVIGDSAYWGRGYATEAIRAGINLAFTTYRMRKLSAGIATGNEGSLKAYTRAGFVVEGVLKGQFIIGDTIADRIEIGCFNPDYFPTEV